MPPSLDPPFFRTGLHTNGSLSQAWGITNDLGSIFFSNDGKKVYKVNKILQGITQFVKLQENT